MKTLIILLAFSILPSFLQAYELSPNLPEFKAGELKQSIPLLVQSLSDKNSEQIQKTKTAVFINHKPLNSFSSAEINGISSYDIKKLEFMASSASQPEGILLITLK